MNLSKVDDELAQVDGFERRRCEREEEEIEEYKSPTCFLISFWSEVIKANEKET
jgi:hypothetical protein